MGVSWANLAIRAIRKRQIRVEFTIGEILKMEVFNFIMTVDQKLGVKGLELGGRGVEQAKQQAASIFVPTIAVPSRPLRSF